MKGIANPALFNLQALFIDDGDSHAQEGAHVRVAHHPLLGLPFAPFVLERADVSHHTFTRLRFREDAVWRDRNGAPLTPPFSMGDGDEVTVTLPLGSNDFALWAEIIADPGSAPVPDRPNPIPDRPIPFPDRPFPMPDRRLPFRGGPRGRFDLGERLRERIVDPRIFHRANATASTMQVEAFMRSATGAPTSLGTRSKPPFAFSGTGLVSFVIRGRGTVVGIRWLDGGEAQKGLEWRVIDVLNLPHEGGRRYLSLSNWQFLCQSRVDAQSPKRRPMQDLASALPRFGAGGHSPAQEFDRVKTLFDGLETPLGELITLPASQHAQITRHKLQRENGDPLIEDGSAEASIPTLGLVLQGQTDPGVGSWMGYKTLDTDRVGDPEQRLSFYRIRGYFRDPSDDVLAGGGFLFTLLMAAARNSNGVADRIELVKDFTDTAGPWLEERQISVSSDLPRFPALGFGAMAVADHLAPLDPLDPPVLGKPEHMHWLPAPITAPIRATETEIDGIPAAGGLAVQMRQPHGTGAWQAVNRDRDTGDGIWRTLILPSVPSDAPSAPVPSGGAPVQTILSHNRTGPEDLSVHAANMDRFGRFSDWGQATGPAGPRPKPPRPVLMGSYTQPDTGTLSHVGRIRAVIPLPEESALAPGSFPLSHVELTVLVDGAPFGATRILPASSADSIHPNNEIPDQSVPAGEDQFGVVLSFDGPAIPRTQSRQLEMTAVWVDSATPTGQPSVASEPVRLTMTDPYPPVQIPIPDVVDYSARPDATGGAWVERDIPGSTANSYAVYYADENRMRDFLRRSSDPADTTLLTQLESQPDPAARATALRAAQTRFPANLFERLEGAVETSPTLRFRHRLPGTLKVLSAYKVAAEAAANAAGPDLTTLDTIFYAVPNSDPPARPSVTVRLVPPEPGEPDLVAEVTVTLRAAMTEGAVARIRRTRSGVADPLTNPVVATVPMGPVDPETGLQTATFRDIGAAQIAPTARLMAFVKYAWLAEVQGVPEPGSVSSASGAVAGLWSEASAPVTLTLVPEDAPEAPTLVGAVSAPAAGGRRDIRMDFTYPFDLTPGTPGPWRIRVERAEPDAAISLVSEDPAPAGTSFRIESAPAEVLPAGTRYRVRVIDPVGRESPAVEHIV